MAAFRALFFLVVAFEFLAWHGLVETSFAPLPVPPPYCNPARRRRREQKSGASCAEESDKCHPCGELPKPKKPDGEYDAAAATAAVARGGFDVLRSEVFDAALAKTALKVFGKASIWGYIGAGILDGVTGGIEAAEQKAAWNRYKLESFISNSTDYIVCQVKAIVGEYFKQYMDFQDLCHYNIGINAMAHVWHDSCHSRQCLNFTNLPANLRGDCCVAGTKDGNSLDCQRWSDEQIAAGQGFCRLQAENFGPGTGVCSADRVCKACMDFDRAIEMTQEQINSYARSPTNWGDALDGYDNIDAIVAQARGTMMMVSYYQELILLGSAASLGNFQLFAASAHQQMQSKLDMLISSAPTVVRSSSCTLSAPPEVVYTGRYPHCEDPVADFCLFTRMGCKRPYSMVGMNGCFELGTKFCGEDEICSSCSNGCSKVSCYDSANNDLSNVGCGSMWEQALQEEQQKATAVLKSLYVEKLGDVKVFLDILLNYSKEPLSMQVFGAYRRLGYRMPSCEATQASTASIRECKHGLQSTMGFGLPHSQFHP